MKDPCVNIIKEIHNQGLKDISNGNAEKLTIGEIALYRAGFMYGLKAYLISSETTIENFSQFLSTEDDLLEAINNINKNEEEAKNGEEERVGD